MVDSVIFLSLAQPDCHHVESRLKWPRVAMDPVMFTSRPDPLLLARIDRPFRLDHRVRFPGLHLHHHQKIILDRDQVDFTVGAAVVAFAYLVP